MCLGKHDLPFTTFKTCLRMVTRHPRHYVDSSQRKGSIMSYPHKLWSSGWAKQERPPTISHSSLVWSENEHWKSSDQFRQVQTGRQKFRCAIFSVDFIFPWRCRQKNHHVRSPPWVLYSTRLWFRTVVIVYTCFFIQTIKVDKQMFQMCQAKIYCFYHQKYGQIKATIDLVNNIKLTSCYCKL